MGSNGAEVFLKFSICPDCGKGYSHGRAWKHRVCYSCYEQKHFLGLTYKEVHSDEDKAQVFRNSRFNLFSNGSYEK